MCLLLLFCVCLSCWASPALGSAGWASGVRVGSVSAAASGPCCLPAFPPPSATPPASDGRTAPRVGAPRADSPLSASQFGSFVSGTAGVRPLRTRPVHRALQRVSHGRRGSRPASWPPLSSRAPTLSHPRAASTERQRCGEAGGAPRPASSRPAPRGTAGRAPLSPRGSGLRCRPRPRGSSPPWPVAPMPRPVAPTPRPVTPIAPACDAHAPACGAGFRGVLQLRGPGCVAYSCWLRRGRPPAFVQ